MSSMWRLRWGRRSVTGSPDWPAGANFAIEPINLEYATPGIERFDGSAYGISSPSRRVSNGLWSNKSTWEGPPCIHRKITRFAREA